MKMVSNHYTRSLPGGAELRQRVLRSQTADDAEAILGAWFDSLEAA